MELFSSNFCGKEHCSYALQPIWNRSFTSGPKVLLVSRKQESEFIKHCFYAEYLTNDLSGSTVSNSVSTDTFVKYFALNGSWGQSNNCTDNDPFSSEIKMVLPKNSKPLHVSHNKLFCVFIHVYDILYKNFSP